MTDLSPDTAADFDTTIDAPLPAEQPAATPVHDAQAAKPQTIDDAIDAAFAKVTGGQPRDEVGRFAPKTAQEQAKAAAAPQAPAPAAEPGQDVGKPVQMPAAWGRDKAALWAAAPPELQAQIAAREEAISRGLSRYEGLASYADLAERNGTNLKQVFDRARGWEEAMQRDPVTAIGHAIRVFNVDPARIVAALSGGAAQPAPAASPNGLPPQYVAELQHIKQSVEELRAAPVQQQVAAFFNDPANKFANQVADTMALFLKSEPGLSLKDAYDRACWADPNVRAAVLQEQQAAQAAKTAAAARASTQRAQSASRSLSGAPVPPLNGAAAPRLRTVDEAISAAFAQHGAPL